MSRVPRHDEPGPYYGHPFIYIGPCGLPSEASAKEGLPPGQRWAVYAADGGAWDRHTLKAVVDTEAEAESIAAELIDNGAWDRLGVIRPPFGGHSDSLNQRNSLKEGD